MITRIGIGAGDILNYLEQGGRDVRMEEMINEMDRNRDLVLMSVGWLAREGHIVLEGDGPDYLIKLKRR
jgi:hypothetical protein